MDRQNGVFPCYRIVSYAKEFTFDSHNNMDKSEILLSQRNQVQKHIFMCEGMDGMRNLFGGDRNVLCLDCSDCCLGVYSY